MAVFCNIWIPGFGILGKHLYEALKETENELLKCKGEQQKAFQATKDLLATTPALRILDLEKPFSLYVAEEWNSPGSPHPKLRKSPDLRPTSLNN